MLDNLGKDMGVFFCLCPSNRALCHVVSKLSNSNLTLELYDPYILPNFETTTNLKLYLRA
jgi:hypothetical protein